MKSRAAVSEPPRRLPPVSPAGRFESYEVVDGVVFFEYSSLDGITSDGRNRQKPTREVSTQTETQIEKSERISAVIKRRSSLSSDNHNRKNVRMSPVVSHVTGTVVSNAMKEHSLLKTNIRSFKTSTKTPSAAAQSSVPSVSRPRKNRKLSSSFRHTLTRKFDYRALLVSHDDSPPSPIEIIID